LNLSQEESFSAKRAANKGDQGRTNQSLREDAHFLLSEITANAKFSNFLGEYTEVGEGDSGDLAQKFAQKSTECA